MEAGDKAICFYSGVTNNLNDTSSTCYSL